MVAKLTKDDIREMRKVAAEHQCLYQEIRQSPIVVALEKLNTNPTTYSQFNYERLQDFAEGVWGKEITPKAPNLQNTFEKLADKLANTTFDEFQELLSQVREEDKQSRPRRITRNYRTRKTAIARNRTAVSEGTNDRVQRYLDLSDALKKDIAQLTPEQQQALGRVAGEFAVLSPEARKAMGQVLRELGTDKQANWLQELLEPGRKLNQR